MAAAKSGAASEVREWVTPDDLNVAPALLGLPLAKPSRRLWAMLVDLLAIGAFSSLANLWLLAALAVVLGERARSQRAGASPNRRRLAWVLAVVLAIVAVQQTATSGRGLAFDVDDEPDADVQATAASAAHAAAAVADAMKEVSPTAAAAASMAAGIAARAASEAAADAATPASREARRLTRKQEVREAVLEMQRELGGKGAPASAAAPASGLASVVAPAPDSAAASSAAPPPSAGAVEPDTVPVLQAKVHRLEQALASAHKTDDDPPAPKTLRERIAHNLDELGLGYGWSIVYFTLLPAWWRGQTLGKRLLGLRVLELTGKPMTAMRNLKRYGGYAAGLATGGLGLVQLLWDSNRQSIQDKTAHTVVVDERRPRRGQAVSSPPAVDLVAGATALPIARLSEPSDADAR